MLESKHKANLSKKISTNWSLTKWASQWQGHRQTLLLMLVSMEVDAAEVNLGVDVISSSCLPSKTAETTAQYSDSS